jgi:hypothetical protein
MVSIIARAAGASEAARPDGGGGGPAAIRQPAHRIHVRAPPGRRHPSSLLPPPPRPLQASGLLLLSRWRWRAAATATAAAAICADRRAAAGSMSGNSFAPPFRGSDKARAPFVLPRCDLVYARGFWPEGAGRGAQPPCGPDRE